MSKLFTTRIKNKAICSLLPEIAEANGLTVSDEILRCILLVYEKEPKFLAILFREELSKAKDKMEVGKLVEKFISSGLPIEEAKRIYREVSNAKSIII